jgi:hypothetical protein
VVVPTLVDPAYGNRDRCGELVTRQNPLGHDRDRPSDFSVVGVLFTTLASANAGVLEQPVQH